MEGTVLAKRKDGKFIAYDSGHSVGFKHVQEQEPEPITPLGDTLKVAKAHKPLKVKMYS